MGLKLSSQLRIKGCALAIVTVRFGCCYSNNFYGAEQTYDINGVMAATSILTGQCVMGCCATLQAKPLGFRSSLRPGRTLVIQC